MKPALALLAVLGSLLLAPGAGAATFAVNSPVDLTDASPGDGTCAAAAPAVCTLRAAIQEANALAGADIVTLPAGSTSTLTIAGTGEEAAATGDLDVTSPITVQKTGSGAAPIVDGGSIDRVFDVRPVAGADLTLDGLTIRHGSVAANGGGVRNSASLSVADSTFTLNTVSGGFGTGSAIDSEATGSTLQVSRSTFDSNQASIEGTIYIGDGTNTVDSSTISNNMAGSSGAGIGVTGGLVTLSNDTISGNTVTGAVSDNGGGGLIADDFDTTTPTQITIDHSTIASNTSGLGSAVRTLAAGIVTVSDSIVQGTCNAFAVTVTGTVLFDDASCGTVGADPVLSPLANNGGPTATRAIGPAGAAVDTAAACGTSALDQRGAPRPQGLACDVGAIELARSSNLGITGVAGPAVAHVGDAVTFTYTVTNAGPDATGGVSISATLPAGATLVSAPAGCSGTATVTCAIGSLASGSQAVRSLVITSSVAGALTIPASVSGNPTDPAAADNSVAPSATLTAAAGPTGPSGPTGTSGPSGKSGPTGAKPPASPRLSSFSASKKSFRARRVKKVAAGTTLRYTLTAPAKVTFTVRDATRCKGTGKKRRCRSTSAGRLRGTLIATRSKAGRYTLKFSGRLKGKALPAGTYRVTAVPAIGRLKGASRYVVLRILA
jgi:uncharacterized repeat protein (TIGR01451 family)/CSLREA domain-containing protein